MSEYNKFTNEQLLDLLISYAQTAWYHHDTGEQEEAANNLSSIMTEVLKRM